MTYTNEDLSTRVIEKPTPKLKKPAMYRVILHNDDFTPRAFVVHVLQKFFSKVDPMATTIMMTAHKIGHASVAVYSYEIAETKTHKANKYGVVHSYPVKFTFEVD